MPVYAAESPAKNRGLFITPLRTYLTLEPGKTQAGSLTVANLTDQPMLVTMSVQQFSVADYSYQYEFAPNKDDWISFAAPQLQLAPNKSATVAYQISPPPSVTPGGHYFSLLATASQQQGVVKSHVQAASILYATVNGPLNRSVQVVSRQVPRVVFGSEMTFWLTAKDTGNTHIFAYTSGQLQGLSTRGKGATVTNMLLPGKVRTLSSTIPSPWLPGLYQATYGFTTDGGQTVHFSRRILYLPPWSVLLLGGVGWVGWLLWRRRHH